MEDCKGVATVIRNYTILPPLKENNVLPHHLYVNSKICKCFSVLHFLESAIETETGIVSITWFGKECLSLEGDVAASGTRICDQGRVILCDENSVSACCLCHGEFSLSRDSFFVDGGMCTETQWHSIKPGDKVGIGYALNQNPDTKPLFDSVFAWMGQQPLLIHHTNVELYFKGFATHLDFGKQSFPGKIVGFAEPNTAVVSIKFKTINIVAILFSKHITCKGQKHFKDDVVIGDIVYVQFGKVEGYELWFIVNAWRVWNSPKSGGPYTLEKKEDIGCTEAAGNFTSLISEVVNEENLCFELNGNTLQEDGLLCDESVIFSEKGEEGKLLKVLNTKCALVLCRGKKVLVNRKNLYLNDVPCMDINLTGEFFSLLAKKGKVMKVEAVSFEVLKKSKWGGIDLEATCVWFGRTKPSLKMKVGFDSSAFSHLHGMRVSAKVVKIVLPFIAVVSFQHETHTVYAALLTKDLKTGRAGLEPVRDVLICKYLHVGDVVDITLHKGGKMRPLIARNAVFNADFKSTSTVSNDHIMTVASENDSWMSYACDEVKKCAKSEASPVKSSPFVNCGKHAFEIKLCTDDEQSSLFFRGRGTLSQIMSPTEAVLHVQPEGKGSAENVLIERDCIFVGKTRCKGFEDIEGLSLSVSCFRMEQEVGGILYRAYISYDILPKLSDRFNLKSAIGSIDRSKKYEGVVFDYVSEYRAVVEIKESGRSFFVLCSKSSFENSLKSGREMKYIFEYVSIGEKVLLDGFVKKGKSSQSHLEALKVYQEHCFLKDGVSQKHEKYGMGSLFLTPSLESSLQTKQSNNPSYCMEVKPVPKEEDSENENSYAFVGNHCLEESMCASIKNKCSDKNSYVSVENDSPEEISCAVERCDWSKKRLCGPVGNNCLEEISCTCTVSNDRAKTISSESNMLLSLEKCSQKCTKSEALAVKCSPAVVTKQHAFEMELCTDGDLSPLFFSGSGTLAEVLSPTEAVLHVKPNGKGSAKNVLVERDCIFVGKTRCKGFEDIEGLPLSVSCFRMEQEVSGILYRAYMSYDILPKLSDRFNLKSAIGSIDRSKKYEGVVFDYESEYRAVVEIKQSGRSCFVLCSKSCFENISKSGREMKYIFEYVSIGEKVLLDGFVKKGKQSHSHLEAMKVYQEHCFLEDGVPQKHEKYGMGSTFSIPSLESSLQTKQSNNPFYCIEVKPISEEDDCQNENLYALVGNHCSEESMCASIKNKCSDKNSYISVENDCPEEISCAVERCDMSKKSLCAPVGNNCLEEISCACTVSYDRAKTISSESKMLLSFEKCSQKCTKSEALAVKCSPAVVTNQHAFEMELCTDGDLSPLFFSGSGTLAEVLSPTEAVLHVKPNGKWSAKNVLIERDCVFVRNTRCKEFEDIEGLSLNVSCFRMDQEVSGILYRAYISYDILPKLSDRFNLKSAIDSIDRSKKYEGVVFNYESEYRAIVEIKESGRSHFVVFSDSSFKNSLKNGREIKCIFECVSIGEEVLLDGFVKRRSSSRSYLEAMKVYQKHCSLQDGVPQMQEEYGAGRTFSTPSLKSTLETKQSDGPFYCTEVKSVSEGSDCSEESLCALRGKFDEVLGGSSSVRSHVSSFSKTRKSKIVSVKSLPNPVDIESQTQEAQHFDGASYVVGLKPDAADEGYSKLESVNCFDTCFSELSEVLGVVSSHKSHSEGIVVVDTLGIKVQFSVSDSVWWDEAVGRQARLRSVQELFPLNSVLMVCALRVSGKNIFKATKVWNPLCMQELIKKNLAAA